MQPYQPYHPGSPFIIQAMRAVLLVLMIALLPLRVWLGNAMAMQNMAGPGNTIENIAVSAYPIRAGTIFYLNSETLAGPCHEAASVAGQASDVTPSTDSAAHSDCTQCSTCQLCHSVALSSVSRLLPLLALPTQALQSSPTRFASVARAPHLKPPIS